MAAAPRQKRRNKSTAVQLRPASPSTDPNNRAPKLSVYGVRGFHAQAYARLIALLASTLIRFFTLTALLSPGTLRAELVEPRQYYAEDIKTAMQLHVDAIVDANGDWSVIDDQTGERLTLRFMQVHDPVRQSVKPSTSPAQTFTSKEIQTKFMTWIFGLNRWMARSKFFRRRSIKNPDMPCSMAGTNTQDILSSMMRSAICTTNDGGLIKGPHR